MDLITAMFDPGIDFQTRANRLRQAVDGGTMIVASLRYLVGSIDDRTVGGFVGDVAEHYQGRLEIVREIAGAAMVLDQERLDDAAIKWAEVANVDRLRPLLEAVYGHTRVRPLVEATGLELNRFLEAFLGTF
jgi:hypothetical protein